MVQLYILQFVLTYISVHLNKKPRRRSEVLFAAHKFNTSLMLNDFLAVMYSIRVPRTTALKFCSNHLLRRRLGGRAEVRTARHLGPSQSGNCFDLEDVTSNVGGTGRKLVYKHRSRASARSGSTASPCRGSRFACCRLWLHTLGNSPVEPVQRQSCCPLVAWGAP